VARRCDDTVDKKWVNSCVLKHLFGGSWATKNIAKKPQICSLRRATNVTFSKFAADAAQKKPRSAVFINSLIRMNSVPKILKCHFLHWCISSAESQCRFSRSCVSCRTALEMYCGSTGAFRLRDSADEKKCAPRGFKSGPKCFLHCSKSRYHLRRIPLVQILQGCLYWQQSGIQSGIWLGTASAPENLIKSTYNFWYVPECYFWSTSAVIFDQPQQVYYHIIS